MARGWVQWVTLPHLSALAPLLDSLSSAQALMLGSNGNRLGEQIVTKNALPWNPGHIARTKDYFDWPDHGAIAMIDHDPNGQPAAEKRYVTQCAWIAQRSTTWSRPSLLNVGFCRIPNGTPGTIKAKSLCRSRGDEVNEIR